MVEDPATAFRRRYRGPLHPDDALWWLDHPNEPAPSGRLPPWLPTESERRALYARDGNPELVRRSATIGALRGSLLDEIAAAARDDSPPAAVRGSMHWRGVAAFVAVLVVAALAGAGAGALLPLPQPSSLQPLHVRSVAASGASDRIRPLASITDPSVELYATAQTGERCLTAIEDDGTTASACATPAQLAEAGLELDLVVAPAGTGGGSRDLVLHWTGRGEPTAAVTP